MQLISWSREEGAVVHVLHKYALDIYVEHENKNWKINIGGA